MATDLTVDSIIREMDVQKLNDQAEYLQVVTSKYKKMEIRLETYEKTHTEMDTAMRLVAFFVAM